MLLHEVCGLVQSGSWASAGIRWGSARRRLWKREPSCLASPWPWAMLFPVLRGLPVPSSRRSGLRCLLVGCVVWLWHKKKKKKREGTQFLGKETVFLDLVASKADHKMGDFQCLLLGFRQCGKNGRLKSSFV